MHAPMHGGPREKGNVAFANIMVRLFVWYQRKVQLDATFSTSENASGTYPGGGGRKPGTRTLVYCSIFISFLGAVSIGEVTGWLCPSCTARADAEWSKSQKPVLLCASKHCNLLYVADWQSRLELVQEGDYFRLGGHDKIA
jgi:hypothetical protein